MQPHEIVALLAAHEGTLIVEANGDVFAVHDPDGTYAQRPRNGWATVVVSDAHDQASDLDRPGVFRLNLGLGRRRQAEVLGGRTDPAEHDLTALDVLLPHPVYGTLGWVCVLNPVGTAATVRALIDEAHERAVRQEDARRSRGAPEQA